MSSFNMKQLYLILIIGIYLFFQQSQISELTFFNKFLINTTQIDFYKNDTAYIYLNNNTDIPSPGSKTQHNCNVGPHRRNNTFLS